MVSRIEIILEVNQFDVLDNELQEITEHLEKLPVKITSIKWI